MTANQSYKLSRLRAVLLFLHTLPAISICPSLQTRAAGLKTIVDDIVDTIMAQTQPLRGSINLREQLLAAPLREIGFDYLACETFSNRIEASRCSKT